MLSVDVSLPERVVEAGYSAKKPTPGRRLEKIKFADSKEAAREYSVPIKGKVGFKHLSKMQHAIEGFFIQSKMDGYLCDNCYNRNTCTQQFYIKDLPQFLIVQLRRFDLSADPPIKIDKEIINDLAVDLSPYIITEASERAEYYYRLYGMVEHMGTLSGGHYVAYAKYKADGKWVWYYISDSHVRESTESHVVNDAQGFLLFYKRITL